MEPDYQVCVCSGGKVGATFGGGNRAAGAEAIVWAPGTCGRVFARFKHEGSRSRDVVQRRAEAWIAAEPWLREIMARKEREQDHKRSQWWFEFKRRGAPDRRFIRGA